MDKIRLNDGTELDCISFATTSVGMLFIRVNLSLAEAVQVFSNKENLSTITFIPEADGEPFSISNFTQLAYIVNEADCVRVALQQPVTIQEVHIND